MDSTIGRRIGYGNFNGDNYTDLVLSNKDEILIYNGGSSGIGSTPSITIDDISTVNYSYPPSVSDFALAISPKVVDMNGDGLTDLIAASDRGLLVYLTHNGTLTTDPSVYDPFVNSTSSLLKVLMLNYGIVYCDNATDRGSCDILIYGE